VDEENGPVTTSEALPARGPALREAAIAAVVVTGAVTAASWLLPKSAGGTVVGFLFLAATWTLVWRRDDETVKRYGLSLGGVVLPGTLAFRPLLRSIAVALAWALGFAAVVFVPFYFGWHFYFARAIGEAAFGLRLNSDTMNEVLTNFVVVALPEEAFYRGYLQSRLDEAWPRRLRIAGAAIGPSVLVTSVVFALGHFATRPDPARLAVFFPSLLFGWLRARTGGIGAPLVFHALCNIYSSLLSTGFHLEGG